MKKSDFFFTIGRIIVDIIAIFSALWFAYFLRMHWYEISILGQHFILFSAPEFGFPIDKYLKFSLKFTAIISIILAIHGRYHLRTDEKILDEVIQVFWGLASAMAVLLAFFFFSKFPFFSRLIFGLSWAFTIIFIYTGRILLRIIRQYFYKNKIGQEKILIIGNGKIAQEAIKQLQKIPRYKIIGTLTDIDKLEKILKEKSPEEVLYCLQHPSPEITIKAIKLTHIYHKNFRIIPDELGLDLAAVKTSTLGTLPLLTLLNTKITGWAYILKTTLDKIAALTAILIFSPLFLFIALKIKFSNTSAPIFYHAPRVGRDGVLFPCYKFRTMIPNADQKKTELLSQNQRDDILFKIDNDPRITKFGKILRKYSLDELPQLYNILAGDMSFIGPRPHLPEEVAKYAPEDRQIFLIKPGLSGFAQINGKSDLSFQEEMKYDIFYMKNWSFWQDAIILIKSILVVARGENK